MTKWQCEMMGDMGGIHVYPIDYDENGSFDTELEALDHGIRCAKLRQSAVTSSLKTMRARYRRLLEENK